jgi:acetate kinase
MSAASHETDKVRPGAKYDRLVAAAKAIPPASTIVVHPCDESSLRGVADAAAAGIIKPILVGPSAKVRGVAVKHGIDISGFELIDAPHSEAAAAKAVELIHAGRGAILMKGSLHTDELMRSVTAKVGGLRTERRISHVFVMDVPAYGETIFVTDAAINIFPDLECKRDIVQNAIDLYIQVGFGTAPRVAILSAVETVTSKIPSTIEAAALCKMADRGQITGGLLDGPLAFDNAIDIEAARIKGIESKVRQHAGQESRLLCQSGWRGHRARCPRTDRADVTGGFTESPDGVLRRCESLRRCTAEPCANSRSVTKMDTILVVNAGSSSVKFQVFAVDGEGRLRRELKGQVDGIGSRPRLRATAAGGDTMADRAYPIEAVPDVPAALMLASTWLREELQLSPLAVGHRVVHGGPDYDRAVLIDHGVVARLQRFTALAPLHQPHNLASIRSLLTNFPALPQVACFDTAFHRDHEDVADHYAIPRWLHDEGIRRYGFHGLSYEYVAKTLLNVAPEIANGRVIVGHLGSGASMCAIHGGRSVESTMGFTALDGLPMGTRAGQIDPGVILYLMTAKGMSSSQVQDFLYRDCGLKGLSGVSSDMRELQGSDDPRAAFAVDYFVHRIALYVGMLAAALQGLDGFVFTGGIGENSVHIRARVAEQMGWLGIALDPLENARHTQKISRADSSIPLYIVPTDEELMIAQHTLSLLWRRETAHNPKHEGAS